MQGTVLYGPRDIRFKDQADPKILTSTDAIIRLSVTCVCGSDLWPYRGIHIRVNAVCPGYIDAPMMDRFTGGTPEGRAKVISEEPIGRMGKPEEIANAVVWLCSEAAGFVVGSAMVIDGGQTVQ